MRSAVRAPSERRPGLSREGFLSVPKECHARGRGPANETNSGTGAQQSGVPQARRRVHLRRRRRFDLGKPPDRNALPLSSIRFHGSESFATGARTWLASHMRGSALAKISTLSVQLCVGLPSAWCYPGRIHEYGIHDWHYKQYLWLLTLRMVGL